MTVENLQEELKRKEWIENTYNRINEDAHTIKAKPTLRESDEGSEAMLRYQLEVLTPATIESLKRRRLEEEEKARKFRDESNVTKLGEINAISMVEKMIEKERAQLKLINWNPQLGSIPSPLDEPIKHKVKKNGWGPFKNMKRANYAKLAHHIFLEREQNMINLALSGAEEADQRNVE